MSIKSTCPLGATCVKTNNSGEVLERCAWHILLQGRNPQTDEVIDRWECSIAALPLLLVENIRTVNGVQMATESFRNEMVQANQISHAIALKANSTNPLLDNTYG